MSEDVVYRVARKFRGVEYFVCMDADGWYWELPCGLYTEMRVGSYNSANHDCKEYILKNLD